MGQGGIPNWRQYPHWARGPALIEGDEIVLDEGRAQPYFLYEPTDLLFDLAEIAADPSDLDPRRAAAFVRRHGLLWHGVDELGTGKCREPLKNWWVESYALAVTIDLYMRLKEAATTGSADPLRAMPFDFMEFIEGGDPEDDEFLIETASLVLAEAISMRLEGCSGGIVSSLGVDVERRSPLHFLLAQNPPDLVTAAYADLAMGMVNRVPMEECQGCGRVFIPQSGKQKYCTKSCSSTNRWRRWKAHQNGE
jgi:hypothetical protein